MPEISSHANLDLASRRLKALKMDELIRRHAPACLDGRMLEIGTGSGYVAQYFAEKYRAGLRVDSVDVADQRMVAEGFYYQVYDGRHLPFTDEIFRVVISNHVIEHVGSRHEQLLHLQQMHRVLRRGGVAYLACPSRWQWREPHYGLPALSWIPAAWRDRYVRAARRGRRYDCNPLGHLEFERLARRAGFAARNLNVEATRLLFELESSRGALPALFGSLPGPLLQAAYRISPTMIYLLEKTERSS